MTNYNERLDEILEDFGVSCARQSVVTLEDANEAKQAILDWHNKQVEELLDKFEQDCKLNYTTWGNSERMLQVSGVLERIEAERNKPKERDDGQL